MTPPQYWGIPPEYPTLQHRAGSASWYSSIAQVRTGTAGSTGTLLDSRPRPERPEPYRDSVQTVLREGFAHVWPSSHSTSSSSPSSGRSSSVRNGSIAGEEQEKRSGGGAAWRR
eukprot:936601-Rhodomonas_salina.2